MFELVEVLDRCTRVELATLFETNHQDLVRHENRALVLAAAWADLHDHDPAEPYAPLIHRMRTVGGDGTPEVSEYAAAELGALQGTGMFSAGRMIVAALDLRHGFPRIWTQVQAGQVRAWQACRVAADTRDLSYEQARNIDDGVGRVSRGAALAADPEAAGRRRSSPPTRLKSTNAASRRKPNGPCTPRSPSTG